MLVLGLLLANFTLAPTSTPLPLHHDPAANKGVGAITLGGETFKHNVTTQQRAAGCTFDRFGFMNLRRGGKHVSLYLDDLTYTSRRNAAKPHPNTVTTVPYPGGGRKY
jgi:hypothetical protein